MKLNFSLIRYSAILLIAPLSASADTPAEGQFRSKSFYLIQASNSLKISVDSTRPIVFLKTTLSPLSTTYAIDATSIVPIRIQPRYIPLVSLHTRFNHQQLHLFNLGIGFRYAIDENQLLGVHLFLDHLYSKNGFFQVLATRMEWFSPQLEFGINSYFTLNGTQRSVQLIANLNARIDFIMSKRFERIKYQGGLQIQGSPVSPLALLAGAEYSINPTLRAEINLVHSLLQANTHVTFGLRMELAQQTPRPGSLQSQLYAPIDRYVFYSTEIHPLPIEYTQPATPTFTPIDVHAYVPDTTYNHPDTPRITTRTYMQTDAPIPDAELNKSELSSSDVMDIPPNHRMLTHSQNIVPDDESKLQAIAGPLGLMETTNERDLRAITDTLGPFL